jgi:hypothetical protein
MNKDLKGLMNVLRQSINDAILESKNVGAALAALKLLGKCPAFTIDISLEDAHQPAASRVTEELVLDDADVAFLAAIGIVDPSWSITPEPVPIVRDR